MVALRWTLPLTVRLVIIIPPYYAVPSSRRSGQEIYSPMGRDGGYRFIACCWQGMSMIDENNEIQLHLIPLLLAFY